MIRTLTLQGLFGNNNNSKELINYLKKIKKESNGDIWISMYGFRAIQLSRLLKRVKSLDDFGYSYEEIYTQINQEVG